MIADNSRPTREIREREPHRIVFWGGPLSGQIVFIDRQERLPTVVDLGRGDRRAVRYRPHAVTKTGNAIYRFAGYVAFPPALPRQLAR